MRKIKDVVCEFELLRAQERLCKALALEASDYFIQAHKDCIEELERGEIEVFGLAELLEVEVESYQVQNRYSGNQEFSITFNGIIEYALVDAGAVLRFIEPIAGIVKKHAVADFLQDYFNSVEYTLDERRAYGEIAEMIRQDFLTQDQAFQALARVFGMKIAR